MGNNMNKTQIFLITKDSRLQIFCSDFEKIDFLSGKLALIENDDDLLEKIFVSDIDKYLYIYDSDFSPKLSSILFVRKMNEISPESKIIILGNGVIEARELINNQACPFRYINKEENYDIVKMVLFNLISKEYAIKKRVADSLGRWNNSFN